MRGFLNFKDESGAELVEYGIAVSILIGVFVLGNIILQAASVEKGRDIIATSSRMTPCNPNDTNDPLRGAITGTHFTRAEVCQ